MKSSLTGVLFLLFLLPSAVLAQDSSIAGGVADSTGGALPGVTVEVSSPVMIEGSRVAVTDGQGRYAMTLLRPGTYRLTYTLAGFSTLVREGIELQAAFTANVDVELSVGDLEETITVSGESPTVDVQRVQQRLVITSEVIDALPMNKDWSQIGVTTVAISGNVQDVGGANPGHHAYLSVHGSDARDGMRRMDGMNMGMLTCGYACTVVHSNDAMTEELSFEIGAISAESPSGGVAVNIIPKEGGNLFSGDAFANFANSSMQGDNLSDELIAGGLTAVGGVKRMWDTHGSLGGPIVEDKLWFHGSYRDWVLESRSADSFFDVNPLDYVYEPDLSRERAFHRRHLQSAALRLTYQANPSNKFSVYFNGQPRDLPNGIPSRTRPPEGQFHQRTPLSYHWTASWTGSVGSQLLFEAGASAHILTIATEPQAGAPVAHAARELSTGVRFRAREVVNRYNDRHRAYKGAMSYVTGSHTFKVGFTLDNGTWKQNFSLNAPTDSVLLLFNGTPAAIIAWATPFTQQVDLKADLGIYAQDTWTINRTTLNLGVRWDYLRADIPFQDTSAFMNRPAGTTAAGTWAPVRQFAAVPKASNWSDINPRLGVAHDVFGDGRTAIKGSISRYMRGDTIGMAQNLNPIVTSVIATSRSWRDTNGDFFPDENELGPFANASFGQTVQATTFDDEVRSGFGNRRYNWEYSLGVERELLPQTAVELSYWRRVNGNFSLNDNLLTDPSDFDEYCVTAPADSRLPGGGGNEICGLYDINPSKFGLEQNEILLTDQLGRTMDQVYDGIDVTISSRFGSDLFFYGGISMGRTRFNDCNARVDNPSVVPSALRGTGGGWDANEGANPDLLRPAGHHCDVTPPFFRPAWKLSGAYTLPYDIQLAGFFQNQPGIPITASWTVPNSDVNFISPDRTSLAGGARTTSVELVEPGTMFADRFTQVDLRVAKSFPVGGGPQLKVMFDAYNVFNSSATLGLNNRFGPAWQNVTQVMLARFFKLGAQLNF